MKTKIITASIIVIAVLVAAYTYMLNPNSFDNINPIAKSSMVKCTLEWGRLAPFPKSKSSFTIYTEGSMFTRSFRSSFYLPKGDLETWIKASPGLQDAEVQKTSDNRTKYIIKPGSKANYAEVSIDFKKSYVEVYVSWS